MKTLLNDVLDETYNHYYNHPGRCGWSKKNDSCEYLTESGKMCAVGRMFKRDVLNKHKENFNFLGTVNDVFKSSDFNRDMLKKKYRELPELFLSDLQQMHDTYAEYKINPELTRFRNSIRNRIKVGAYEDTNESL